MNDWRSRTPGPTASGGRKCSLRITMLRSSSYRSPRCSLGALGADSSDGARSILRQASDVPLEHFARRAKHGARHGKRVENMQIALDTRRVALRDARRGARRVALGRLDQQLVVHLLQDLACHHEPVKARELRAADVLLDERGRERLDGFGRCGCILQQIVRLQRAIDKLHSIRTHLKVVLRGKGAQNDAPHIRRDVHAVAPSVHRDATRPTD